MGDFEIVSVSNEEVVDLLENELDMFIPLGEMSDKDFNNRISKYLIRNLPNVTKILETKEVRRYYDKFWKPLHWIPVIDVISNGNIYVL